MFHYNKVLYITEQHSTLKKMIADSLTKEQKDMDDLMAIVEINKYDGIDFQQKKVICKYGEVKLTLRNKL